MAEKSPASIQTCSRQEFGEFPAAVSYRSGDFDPRQSLSQVSVAGLWIFGSKDPSIPVDLSVARLEELIREGHGCEFEVFPDEGDFDFRGRTDPRYQAVKSWITTTASRHR